MTIETMFEIVARYKASDIILTPGVPPAVWVAGRMCLSDGPDLTPEDVTDIFLPQITEDQRAVLNQTGDLDFSIGRKGVGRFRINLHRQRGSLSAAVRFIPTEVPAFKTLTLPPRVLELARLPRGLVLVTGGAGTGKSTTLAAMIDAMNQSCSYHIITLEDPIEYTFRHGQSIIEQREIGVDAVSFASGLRHVVRQRPDVVLIGEMRDLETISTALTAAETGHLVLATLHTTSAVATVERIIDVFPSTQQSQVRVQLSGALQAVVCQMLFHDNITDGLVPAVEILVPTPGIRRAIRDNETHLIRGMMETGVNLGMQTMDSSIANLAAQRRITHEQALQAAHDTEKMRRLLAA